MDLERETSSLDDDRPGSQGEIDPGSEGDFGGPPPVDEEADDEADDEEA